MIDGYKCRDGKVIVVNYDVNNEVIETEREYQDNIDELLRAENMEEHLNSLVFKYKNDIDNYGMAIDDCSTNIIAGYTIIGTLTLLGLLLCMLKPWIPLLVGFFGSLAFSNIKLIIPSKRKIRKTQKEIKALEFILEGIKEEQQKNQKDLRRLRNDVRAEKEDIDSNYRQFDSDELSRMDDYLELWGFAGKNEDDLLWYEKQGCFYRNLNDQFRDDEIMTIRRILKRNDKRY